MAIYVLPDLMEVGAQVSWDVGETTIRYAGGQVQTNRNFPYPLAEVAFNTGVLDTNLYNTGFLNPYEVLGQGVPFLVKLRSRYTITDELMGGTANGANLVFTLQETLTIGDTTITRPIEYIDAGTLVVEDDGVPVSVDTVVNEVVTLNAAPATSSVMTASGEFWRLMLFTSKVTARVGNDEQSGVATVRAKETVAWA